jgi:hypothetical protein
MSIYINNSSMLYQDGTNMVDYLNSRNIEIFIDRNLKDIEKDCFVSLLDLSTYEDSNVSLKCGAEVGLSDLFKLLIIVVTNPSNEKLNHELLIKFKANLFEMEDIVLFLKDARIFEKIESGKEMLNNCTSIEQRSKFRKYLSKDLNDLVNDIKKVKEYNSLAEDVAKA